MTAQAPLSVACCLKAVAPHPPEIRMITGRPGAVALDTVVPVMTHITGSAARARLIPAEVDKGAVKPDPVTFMRVRRREGDTALFNDTLLHFILPVALLHGYFRRE